MACLAAMLVFGCTDDDDADTGGGPGGTGSTSGSEGASTDGETAATQGQEATASADDTGDPSGPGETTDLPEACVPKADDSECDTCVKENCCAQADACLADEDCQCFQACADGNPSPFSCYETCEIGLEEPGPTKDIVTCTTMHCASACL